MLLIRVSVDVIKPLEQNNSYKNKDNFLFYPHEEIVSFVNRKNLITGRVDSRYHLILKRV